MTDIMLVEDVPETVEGLEADLRLRGADVFRFEYGQEASESLANDEWSLLLFDLRIPEHKGSVEMLEIGLQLIDDNLSGRFGSSNAQTPFAIVTQQTVVAEVEHFYEYPIFLGLFNKSEDHRLLFRTLEEHGLLEQSALDSAYFDAPSRRRVKFILHSVDVSEHEVVVSVPAWRDDHFRVSLSKFLPGVRRELLQTKFPVFIYGTIDSRAQSPDGLNPADFERLLEPRPPYRLIQY